MAHLVEGLHLVGHHVGPLALLERVPTQHSLAHLINHGHVKSFRLYAMYVNGHHVVMTGLLVLTSGGSSPGLIIKSIRAWPSELYSLNREAIVI